MAKKTGRPQKFGEPTNVRRVRLPVSKESEIMTRIENEVLIDYTTEEYKQKQKSK